MANIYIISCDIHATEAETYDKTSCRVESLFRELALSDDSFAYCASTTYLLKTTQAANQVAAKVHQSMNNKGNVIVAKIAGDNEIIGDDDKIIKELLKEARK